MDNNQYTADPRDKQKITNNGSTDTSDDTLGDETGDSAFAKGNEPGLQDKPDAERVKTVTPSNDNGDPGPSTEKPSANKGMEAGDTPTSNKGQGPSGENL